MSEYLSKLSKKDKPWDTHKASSTDIATLFDLLGYEKYPKRVSECAESLSFRWVVAEDGSRRLRLKAAKFCRVRQCPICQWRRSLMWTARFHKSLPSILSDYPTAKFLFLTLTVRNCELDDLRETIAHMNASWNRMTLRKFFPAIGYVKSIEVTKGQDGLAHPHIHALLMVPSSYFKTKYIKQVDWTEHWKKAVRVDYTPIVNIKSVQKPRSGNGDITKQLMNAVKETLKYSVKPSDLIGDPDWLDGITTALHKTRSVSLGGIFRQYLSEDEPEDLINTDTDTEKDELLLDEDILLFDWAEMVRKYRQRL